MALEGLVGWQPYPSLPGATGRLEQVQRTYYAKDWWFDRLTTSGIQSAQPELVEGDSYLQGRNGPLIMH